MGYRMDEGGGDAGRREERDSGPWGARRPARTPIINAPAVVLWLILAVAGVFALMAVAPGASIAAVEQWAALYPERFLQGPERGLLAWIAPLIAHQFVHASLAHLGFNSIWLLAFGAPVARRIGEGAVGAGRFMAFFLASGIAGGLAFTAVNPTSDALLVGASGAVSGLLGALVRFGFSPRQILSPGGERLAPLLHPRVLAASVVIVLINLASGFLGETVGAEGGRIAWEAHLGGYFFGLVAFPIFDRAARQSK